MAKKPVDFARAHLVRARDAARKRIRGAVIVGRFCNCLGLPPGVDPDKKLTEILGGGLEKWDLGLQLMSYRLFKADGLILQKADVLNADTVSELGDLVFKWYRANGWTVE